MTVCAVVGCKSSNDKRRIKYLDNVAEVSFCRFPRDEGLRKLWLYRCGREENCKAKRLFVCIRHFKQSDYVRNLRHELLEYHPKTSRKVKVDAIPSLFLPPSVVVPACELIDNAADADVSTTTTNTKICLKNPESNVQKKPIIIEPKTIPTPISNTNHDSNINTAEIIQSDFIDHVVMVYLNRCRSRAGNPNVGMPQYILRRKAQEAAISLGASYLVEFHWIERFQRKLAEHDAKGIVLSPHHESLSIADIISEEWPKFADLKGLDIDEAEDSEETIGVDENETTQTEIVKLHNEDVQSQHKELPSYIPMDNDVQLQANKDLTSNRPRSKRKVASRTTKVPLIENDLNGEFLKHVLMVFIARFKATWPQAYIPDIILNAKFREAASILQPEIKNRNAWLAAFKLDMEKKSHQPIITEPNQSLNMNDIITEERIKFDLKNKTTTTLVIGEVNMNEISTADEPERKNVECPDSIETYEEARDCLKLLNKYALELGDSTALKLIEQADSYLRSDDCN